MTQKQNYSDLYFKNAQLTKLVELAESMFENICSEVSIDKRKEIDKWLCYKKEFDACCETKCSDEPRDIMFMNLSAMQCAERVRSAGNSSETFSSSESWCSSDEIYTDEDNNECSEDMNLNFATSGFVSSPSDWCLDESVFRNRGLQFTFGERNKQINKRYGQLKSPFSWDQVARCDYGVNEYRKNYSMLMNSQIENLREIKTTLLNVCQNYTSHYKRYDPFFKMNRRVLLIQEVIEMMDTSIEMKNNSNLLDNQILRIIESDRIVYSSLLNYSEFLTIKEIQYLLMWYLTRYIDLRENSSISDRLILSLDNKIIEQKIKLKNLEGDLLKIHSAVVTLKSKNKHRLSNRIPNLNCIIQTLESKQNMLSASSTFLQSGASTPNVIAVHGTKQDGSKTYDVAQQGKKLVIEKD